MAAVRGAVRGFLAHAETAGALAGRQVVLAVSGGADSLALAALAVPLARRAGLTAHGVVVDHRLQDDSARVAERAAEQVRGLGADTTRVLPVSVAGRGGLEAAARRARYAALRDAAPGALVLLGHTQDDQAETVLLGLGRGSGPRSIAGMRPLEVPWGRPLLGVSRSTTEAACAALGLAHWSDPHNADPAFARVRLRTEVLPLLEQVLRGGVRAALARTAGQLREDLDLLDDLAAELRAAAAGHPESGPESDPESDSAPAAEQLDAEVLAAAPGPLRRRALRGWLLDAGVRELTEAQIRCVDELVSAWRGQGGVSLPGGLVAGRSHGRLTVVAPPADAGAGAREGNNQRCIQATSPPS